MTLNKQTVFKKLALAILWSLKKIHAFTNVIQTSRINGMKYLCNKVIALETCVIIAYQLNNSLLKLLVMNVNLPRLSHVWEYADVQ